MIKRVHNADPLLCPKCEAEMGIISFLDWPEIVHSILDHIHYKIDVLPLPPLHHPPPVSYSQLDLTPDWL